MVEPKNLVAHRTHLGYGVGDENRGCATTDNLLHFLLALLSKGAVTHRQYLVEDKYVGLYK